MRWVHLAWSIFVMALGMTPMEGRAASFTALGDLPGGLFLSYADGISADGRFVVGEGWDSTGFHAFIWDRTNGMRRIDKGNRDFRYTTAMGVSSDGSYVVGSGVDLEGKTRPFLWSASTGMQALGGFAEDTGLTWANGVSADGQTVVGTFERSEPITQKFGFIWDPTNGVRSGTGLLPSVPRVRELTDVSSDGSTFVGNAAQNQAFVWDREDGLRNLNGYAVVDVSSDGSAVAGHSTVLSGPSFVWDSVNGVRWLGHEAGSWPYVTGVSDGGGVAVGYTDTGSGNAEFGAFIWDPIHGIQDLKLVLTAMGIDLEGWLLAKATGISSDGRTIAGYGFNPDGKQEAWVVVIPEPGAGLLLGIGLAGLASSGRMRIGSIRNRARRALH